MRKLFTTLTLIGVAACVQPNVEAGSDLARVLNKPLSNELGSFVIAANGTFDGTINGETLTGIWRVEDGFFCRSGTLGTTAVPDACQSVTVSGNRLTLRRDRGAGQATRYTIGG